MQVQWILQRVVPYNNLARMSTGEDPTYRITLCYMGSSKDVDRFDTCCLQPFENHTWDFINIRVRLRCSLSLMWHSMGFCGCPRRTKRKAKKNSLDLQEAESQSLVTESKTRLPKYSNPKDRTFMAFYLLYTLSFCICRDLDQKFVGEQSRL